MTALVQPRHVKLGLAGSEQNWAYAAYELDQLRETFADLAEILPKCRDLSIPDMITSTVKEPLAALDRAIQAKDGNQFTEAYRQLTVSCNTCHQAYDRAVIVIQPPTASAFPDQDFRPSNEVISCGDILLRSPEWGPSPRLRGLPTLGSHPALTRRIKAAQ
jgi:hypothetical protein